jgi:ABC-type antimicrobial peptide transport system permease subunit
MRSVVSLPLPWSTVGKCSAGARTIARGVGRLAKEKPLGACGAMIVLILLLCAFLAHWIAPYPYDQTNVRHRLKPPVRSFILGPITLDVTSLAALSMAPASP